LLPYERVSGYREEVIEVPGSERPQFEELAS
jgi:hypothetical protein